MLYKMRFAAYLINLFFTVYWLVITMQLKEHKLYSCCFAASQDICLAYVYTKMNECLYFCKYEENNNNSATETFGLHSNKLAETVSFHWCSL